LNRCVHVADCGRSPPEELSHLALGAPYGALDQPARRLPGRLCATRAAGGRFGPGSLVARRDPTVSQVGGRALRLGWIRLPIRLADKPLWRQTPFARPT